MLCFLYYRDKPICLCVYVSMFLSRMSVRECEIFGFFLDGCYCCTFLYCRYPRGIERTPPFQIYNSVQSIGLHFYIVLVYIEILLYVLDKTAEKKTMIWSAFRGIFQFPMRWAQF